MSHLRPVPTGDARPVKGQIALGFLTPHDPYDATSFSGTAFHAFAALKRHPGINLQLLGPHAPRGRVMRLLRRRPAKPAPEAFDLSTETLAPLDAVVGLVASQLLDHLPETTPPFIHVTDATPASLVETYGYDLSHDVFAREARIAARSAACVYSSAAIARRAPGDLGLARLVPQVLPFGLNLAPETPVTRTPPAKTLELLFVGLDWTRKGGDIAVDALRHLRAEGIDARLTVVGSTPSALAREDGITVMGFLDKNRARDVARLSALYARAHLLVLPTRGDCTPMVIGEAMAHGTPVLATDTGGVAEAVGAPGAGRIMPLSAGARDWAHEIAAMTRDAQGWTLLSDAARDRAESRFSWDAWASGIAAIAQEAAFPAHPLRYGT